MNKFTETEWFAGYVPVEPKPFEWKKAKLSLELWHHIVGFMHWTQQKYKAEAQLRLYYNEVLQKWSAFPFPQSPSGMTTKEDPEHEMMATLRAKADLTDPNWLNLGTVHHHCTTGAFQSGTDHKDEIDQDGLHVTLGHMEADELDIHARFSFSKKMLLVDNLSTFIDFDGHLSDTLEKHTRIKESVIRQNGRFPFPQWWKEAIFEKKIVASAFGNYGGYGGYYGRDYSEPMEMTPSTPNKEEIRDIAFEIVESFLISEEAVNPKDVLDSLKDADGEVYDCIVSWAEHYEISEMVLTEAVKKLLLEECQPKQ